MGIFGILIMIVGGLTAFAHGAAQETKEAKIKIFVVAILIMILSIIMITIDASAKPETEKIIFTTDMLEISGYDTFIFEEPVKVIQYKEVYPFYASIRSAKTKYVIKLKN